MHTLFTEDTLTIDKVGTFYFDGNSKVTVNEGTFANPSPNCFSLVQVLDCPGSTPTCRSECYVHGLHEAVPGLHNKYVHNSINLRRILEDPVARRAVEVAFADWIKKHVKEHFRWHVSGDVISAEHALFIRTICQLCPDITFWIYTRTFEHVWSLVEAENLVVNLSVDKDNFKEGYRTHQKNNCRLCYMTVDGKLPVSLPKGSVIFPSYGVRGRDLPDPTEHPWWQRLSQAAHKMVCPADFFGQSESMRCGPCDKCLVPYDHS